MTASTLPPAYFDRLYAEDIDPWRFRSSDYEREKYADTVAALDGVGFPHAVEIGCSIGELTAVLAPHCGALLGVDVAEAPLAAARERNAASPHVRFERMTLPDQTPDGRFDLIVLSEVLYYFGDEDLGRMAAWTQGALAPGGVALLVHWLGETPDYPQSGDEAVESFLTALRGRLTMDRPMDRRWRREHYRIDRLRRPA